MPVKANSRPLPDIERLTPEDAAILRDHLLQDLDYPQDHRDVRLLGQAASNRRRAGMAAALPLVWEDGRVTVTQPYAYVVEHDDVPPLAGFGQRVGCVIRLMLSGFEIDLPAWRTKDDGGNWSSEDPWDASGVPEVTAEPGSAGDGEDAVWTLHVSGNDGTADYTDEFEVAADVDAEDAAINVQAVPEGALDDWEPNEPSDEELKAAVLRAGHTATVSAYGYAEGEFDDEEPEEPDAADFTDDYAYAAAYATWEESHGEWEEARERFYDEREYVELDETVYVGRHFDDYYFVWGDRLYGPEDGDIAAMVVSELHQRVEETGMDVEDPNAAEREFRDELWRVIENAG